jgi:hypothetical protein
MPYSPADFSIGESIIFWPHYQGQIIKTALSLAIIGNVFKTSTTLPMAKTSPLVYL